MADETSPIAPMEALLIDALPEDEGWQFELKWDGFRCIAAKTGGEVTLWAKSGKPLGRYFPEVVEAVRVLAADDFVLDGELIGFTHPNGASGFESLQMRLHPAASRISKLSREMPARLTLFDIPIAPGGVSMIESPLTERRAKLEAVIRKAAPNETLIELSQMTRDLAEAREWLAQSDTGNDGIIAKRLDGPYVSGERAMRKIKRMRTADCVVGGFRYGTGSELVGSLLLGLYNADGKLDHVGFTSQISNAERPALTETLKALQGGPGFTGNAPGGPSRWSTEKTGTYEPLRHELVVEVGYDHMTGGRFRHGSRLLRWRPDKAPAQCTYEQLA